MKKFRFWTKVFIYAVWTIFSVCFIPLSLYSLMSGNYPYAILYLFMETFATAVCAFNLYYYGKLVKGISYEGDMTVIETHIKTYRLPSKGFYEVVDSEPFVRIFIKYADDDLKRTFIFQKQYSPFKKYSLDLDLMRRKMPNAVFLKK